MIVLFFMFIYCKNLLLFCCTKIWTPLLQLGDNCIQFFSFKEAYPRIYGRKFSLMLTNKSSCKVSKGFKDQEWIQSSTTTDPEYQWESDKLIVRHHKREPRGQPFPSR